LVQSAENPDGRLQVAAGDRNLLLAAASMYQPKMTMRSTAMSTGGFRGQHISRQHVSGQDFSGQHVIRHDPESLMA
jgi:hypothetical protein